MSPWCRTPEELPEIEQSSAAVARLREDLQSLDDQLAALTEGAAIGCSVGEAEIVNADELPGEVQRLSEEIQGLESQRDDLLGTIAVEEQALAAMDSGDETTEAAEEAQDILARIEGDALQYIRLRLAMYPAHSVCRKMRTAHGVCRIRFVQLTCAR